PLTLHRFYYAMYLFVTRRPLEPTLIPYTTLFRSGRGTGGHQLGVPGRGVRCTGLVLSPAAAVVAWPVNHLGTVLRLGDRGLGARSEEHTSELQSRFDLVCRLLHEKK